MQSDWVLHQSGSSEEDKKDKKEYEGKLENKSMEGAWAEAIIVEVPRM